MLGASAPGPVATGRLSDGRVAAFGGLLFVAFVLSVVMLVTDKNLQTDFGAQSPYYVHWYGVLAMAMLDLVVAIALVSSALPRVRERMSPSFRRTGVGAALVWTIVAILVLLGIVFSYAQVGFSSMSQFAQYLFGVSAYPGALSYLPWLYDLLLATYGVTAIAGALAVRRISASPPRSVPT
jgi:hypothetical protein